MPPLFALVLAAGALRAGAAQNSTTTTATTTEGPSPTQAPTTTTTTPSLNTVVTTTPTGTWDYLYCESNSSRKTGSTSGRPNLVGNYAGDAVYSFCTPRNGRYTFSTCNSSFDTYLRLYSWGLGYQVYGCDDCGSCGSRTVFSYWLQQGQCYQVVVDGYRYSEGYYELTVQCPATTTTTTTATTSTSTGTWRGPGSTEALLFEARGESMNYSNAWGGWYAAGGAVSSGEGKREEYDSLPLLSLALSDSTGNFAEYELNAPYLGLTLLQIAQRCVGGDRANRGTAAWGAGLCSVGAPRASGGWALGLLGENSSLRVGVGDGTSDTGDWALFMPLPGNGGGDFAGWRTYAIGSEFYTNTGFSGLVRITGTTGANMTTVTLTSTTTTLTTTTSTTTTRDYLFCDSVAGSNSSVKRGSTVGLPNVGAGYLGGDAVHPFCAPHYGLYAFDTCGSSLDTVLRIYSRGFQYQMYHCDDCGPCGFQSSLTVWLYQGQCVEVAVDGWAGREGSYELRVTCNATTPVHTTTMMPAVSSLVLRATAFGNAVCVSQAYSYYRYSVQADACRAENYMLRWSWDGRVLRSEFTGYCLGAHLSVPQLAPYPCAAEESKWSLENGTLVSSHKAWCLTARNYTYYNRLTLDPCNQTGSAEQQWYLDPGFSTTTTTTPPPPLVFLRPVAQPDECVRSSNASLGRCSDGTDHQFRWEATPWEVQLRSPATSLCLAVRYLYYGCSTCATTMTYCSSSYAEWYRVGRALRNKAYAGHCLTRSWVNSYLYLYAEYCEPGHPGQQWHLSADFDAAVPTITTSTTTTTTTTAITSVVLRAVASGSKRCLRPYTHEGGWDSHVQAEPCSGDAWLMWTWTGQELRSEKTGLCASVAFSSSSKRLFMGGCGQNSSRWSRDGSRFVSWSDGGCLLVDGSSYYPGLGFCDTRDPRQEWDLDHSFVAPAPGPVAAPAPFLLVAANTSRCLQVVEGVPVYSTCDGGAAQQWKWLTARSMRTFNVTIGAHFGQEASKCVLMPPGIKGAVNCPSVGGPEDRLNTDLPWDRSTFDVSVQGHTVCVRRSDTDQSAIWGMDLIIRCIAEEAEQLQSEHNESACLTAESRYGYSYSTYSWGYTSFLSMAMCGEGPQEWRLEEGQLQVRAHYWSRTYGSGHYSYYGRRRYSYWTYQTTEGVGCVGDPQPSNASSPPSISFSASWGACSQQHELLRLNRGGVSEAGFLQVRSAGSVECLQYRAGASRVSAAACDGPGAYLWYWDGRSVRPQAADTVCLSVAEGIDAGSVTVMNCTSFPRRSFLHDHMSWSLVGDRMASTAWPGGCLATGPLRYLKSPALCAGVDASLEWHPRTSTTTTGTTTTLTNTTTATVSTTTTTATATTTTVAEDSDAVGTAGSLRGTTTAPSPAPTVQVAMTVKNVDYNALAASASAMANFKGAIAAGVAETAGPGIEREHVEVAVSQGSVRVEATIRPPATVDTASLASGLASASASAAVSAAVVSHVQRSDLGGAVQGELTVEGVAAALVVAPTPAPLLPGGMADSGSHRTIAGLLLPIAVGVALCGWA